MTGAISTITAFAIFHHVGSPINLPVRKRNKGKELRDVTFVRFSTFYIKKPTMSIKNQLASIGSNLRTATKKAEIGSHGGSSLRGLATSRALKPGDRSLRQSRKPR